MTGPGRPPIGPPLKARLPDDLREALDVEAKSESVPVAEDFQDFRPVPIDRTRHPAHNRYISPRQESTGRVAATETLPGGRTEVTRATERLEAGASSKRKPDEPS